MKNRSVGFRFVGSRDKNKLLKGLIWAYFFLLLFEGALRKWILPDYSTPLLVAREPIVLCILFYSVYKRLFSYNLFSILFIIISFVSFIVAVFITHQNVVVALYGVRIFFLHLPLMFVIGNVFRFNDVVKLGRVMLWLSIPMTVLILFQFYTPQSSWFNLGIAGDLGGAGFGGANGFFRPPGTFSFISGTVAFYSLLSCFVSFFWFNSKYINRILLIASTFCLLIAIPFSISRTLFFQFVLCVLFVLFLLMRKPKHLFYSFFLSVFIIMILFFLSKTEFLGTAVDAFITRFIDANETEGGLVKGVAGNRFLGGLLEPIKASVDMPFWGMGVGIGTNVGAKLIGSTDSFLAGEQEWARIVGELGFLLGLSVIFLRVFLACKMIFSSLMKIKKMNYLPWLLSSYGFLLVLQGQTAQPTNLGFLVVVGGLILASLKSDSLRIRKKAKRPGYIKYGVQKLYFK